MEVSFTYNKPVPQHDHNPVLDLHHPKIFPVTTSVGDFDSVILGKAWEYVLEQVSWGDSGTVVFGDIPDRSTGE